MVALIFEHFPLMYDVISKFYMLLGSLVVFLLFGCNFFFILFDWYAQKQEDCFPSCLLWDNVIHMYTYHFSGSYLLFWTCPNDKKQRH